MKHLLVLVYFSLIIFWAGAQTPSAFIGTGLVNKSFDKEKANATSVSANNFWMGAQVGYKFSGSDDFSDNLLVSGRLLYNIVLSNNNKQKFHLPVMGDISTLRDAISEGNTDSISAKAQDLLLSTQGINVGLYPYYIFSENDFFSFTLHGSATYKINSFKVNDNTEYLDQGRFSVGVETSIGKRTDGHAPLTLSVAPIVTVFSEKKYQEIFNESKNSITSLELTGIIPIGSGFGLLIETVITKSSAPAVRAGILFAVK